ncbi:hypothetical protein [Peptoniphilus lacydonensis]|uniref:hypothetical protein n=1 Tax=Peptoniphilus lacydonensis TaxID=1673725 RepID=UPI00290806E5|nr:hypothetical protein [Peptoniphilus lacydonensis]MDU5377344.1 hypothetical protein [Peptoniphilus lacydonensis]MDU5436205.1 hypothetical protein [Peptoniphilus lacydonensis]
MIVKVIKDYFDKSDNKKLRVKGSIIEYKDDDRAKELIKHGVAEEITIEVVEPSEKESGKDKAASK